MAKSQRPVVMDKLSSSVMTSLNATANLKINRLLSSLTPKRPRGPIWAAPGTKFVFEPHTSILANCDKTDLI